MQCPTTELQMSCNKGSGQLTITPDSGSEMTTIGLHHLKQLGMKITHLLLPSLANLYAANDTSLLATFMLNYATMTQQLKQMLTFNSAFPIPFCLGIIPVS